MKKKSPAVILSKAFKRQQEANPRFSLRTLAKKVGVSHVFLGKVLKGEVELPRQRLADVVRAFGLDDLAIAELKTALQEKYQIDESFQTPKKQLESTNQTLLDFEEKSLRAFEALANWYELPLLDLLTCDDSIEKSPQVLATALGISVNEVTSAVRRLTSIGLITANEDGTFKKTQKLLRFPMKMPFEVTQNYYKKVLRRAHQELENRSQESYDKRLMTNLSIAVDPDKVPVAKQKLQKFLHELSLELSDGNSQQVYFLTTLFFPVSKKMK